MAKFRKKPVVIEAYQWFKNGDHPLDGVGMEAPYYPGSKDVYIRQEGLVVRHFRDPDIHDEEPCGVCREIAINHGFIDTMEGGHRVCPGDWIITGIQGERYPCKPDIFAATYEAVED